MWPLTQSSYRSSQWTLSWSHKLPSPVHRSPCFSRTLTVTWSPTWSVPALLEPLTVDWGLYGNPRTSSTANSVWPLWWSSLFLLCSLLPFCSSTCWTRVHILGILLLAAAPGPTLPTPWYNPPLNSTTQIRVLTFSFASFLQCSYPEAFPQRLILLFPFLASLPYFLAWAITLHGVSRCYLCV